MKAYIRIWWLFDLNSLVNTIVLFTRSPGFPPAVPLCESSFEAVIIHLIPPEIPDPYIFLPWYTFLEMLYYPQTNGSHFPTPAYSYILNLMCTMYIPHKSVNKWQLGPKRTRLPRCHQSEFRFCAGCGGGLYLGSGFWWRTCLRVVSKN